MQEWLDYMSALADWYATETKRALDAAGGAQTDGVTPGPPTPPPPKK